MDYIFELKKSFTMFIVRLDSKGTNILKCKVCGVTKEVQSVNGVLPVKKETWQCVNGCKRSDI